MAISPALDAPDQARRVLRVIAAEHPDALDDPGLMASVLADLLPAGPRTARLIVTAVEHGVVRQLRDRAAQGVDAAAATRLAAGGLADATMLRPEPCAWVAGELAAVVGLAGQDARPLTVPKSLGDGQVDDPSPEPSAGHEFSGHADLDQLRDGLGLRQHRPRSLMVLAAVVLVAIAAAAGYLAGHAHQRIEVRTVDHVEHQTSTRTVTRWRTRTVTKTVGGSSSTPCVEENGTVVPAAGSAASGAPGLTTCTLEIVPDTPAADGDQLVITAPDGTSNSYALGAPAG
jgi:hypothetical protein